MLKETNDANFETDILKNENLVLVDFWAPWCGPCRQLLPVVEEIAVELKDTLQCFKASIEDCEDTAAKLEVRSIPCLMLFKNGTLITSKVGRHTKESLLQWIKTNE